VERTAAPIVHRRAITADELEMSADVDKAAIARTRKQAKIAAAELPCGCEASCACWTLGAHRRGDDIQDIDASRLVMPYGSGNPPPGRKCYRCANKGAAASGRARYVPKRKSEVFDELETQPFVHANANDDAVDAHADIDMPTANANAGNFMSYFGTAATAMSGWARRLSCPTADENRLELRDDSNAAVPAVPAAAAQESEHGAEDERATEEYAEAEAPSDDPYHSDDDEADDDEAESLELRDDTSAAAAAAVPAAVPAAVSTVALSAAAEEELATEEYRPFRTAQEIRLDGSSMAMQSQAVDSFWDAPPEEQRMTHLLLQPYCRKGLHSAAPPAGPWNGPWEGKKIVITHTPEFARKYAYCIGLKCVGFNCPKIGRWGRGLHKWAPVRAGAFLRYSCLSLCCCYCWCCC
jgi:hypothetical protein